MTTTSTAPNGAVPIGYRKKLAGDTGKEATKHAAGVVFVAPDGDILLLRRAGTPGTDNYVGHWSLPGGGGEEGEQPEDTARRESREEMGVDISDDAAPMKPLDRRVTPTGMAFHTFASPAKEKFVPKLNDEHNGYAWSSLDMLPRPLHPAVEQTIREQIGMADDMQPEDWAGLRDGFLKWTAEEEAEPEHGATDSALRLALDRDTVRVTRRDGQLHVIRAPISKANVCPYKGSEIPGWKILGLEPDKIYQLLRDPEELRKGAATSNGVQLLRKHIPVNADDHRPYDTVGSLGTDAEYEDPYLYNSLFVNARDAIDGIESNKKRELSSGYHYTPDMTPGEFDGKRYDGVMRDIVFNHVALVEDGRAGPDVVVGDSMENLMSKPTRLAALTLGLTAAHCAPLLAMDKKLTLPKALFAEITSKNFKDKKAGLLAGVRLALDGNLRKGLALDEGTTGLAKLLDALEGTAEGNDESVSEEQHKAMEAAAAGKSDLGIPESVGKEIAEKDEKKPGAFDAEAVKSFLRGKGMGEDDIDAVSGMFPQAAVDEDPAEKEKREKEEAAKKADAEKTAKDNAMKDMKPAMDAAIETAVAAERKRAQGVRVAMTDVKPWIGDVPVTLALDSAEGVYRHALTALGVEGAAALPEAALWPVLKVQPKPGATPAPVIPKLGMDAAAREGLKGRIGIDLDRIGRA